MRPPGGTTRRTLREDDSETTEARSIAAEVVTLLVEEGYLSDVDPQSEPPKDRAGRYSEGIANVIQSAGGVIVATFGLVTVLAITVNLVDNVAQDQRAALITTAFTVIGTLVGGYIGARAGGAGRDEAEKARDREAGKVRELAAQVNPAEYQQAMRRADSRERNSGKRP